MWGFEGSGCGFGVLVFRIGFWGLGFTASSHRGLKER